MHVCCCVCACQAAFADIQSRYSHSSPQLPGGKAGGKWPRTLPEHSTASFAQLMLLHGAGWPNHLMWENWQAAHPAGALTMFVHMKVGGLGTEGSLGGLQLSEGNRQAACFAESERGVPSRTALLSAQVWSAAQQGSTSCQRRGAGAQHPAARATALTLQL